MKKLTLRAIVLMLVVAGVFVMISLFLPAKRNAAFWLSFGFGLLAIVFQLYVFNAAEMGKNDARSRFYGFSVARVGLIYLAVQLILSLIVMVLCIFVTVPAWCAVIPSALLFAAAVVGCITTETVRDEVVRQDAQLKKDVTFMRGLQSLAASLASVCPEGELKAKVKKLAEELRFSDPVSSAETVPLEEDILQQMKELQQAITDGDRDGAGKLCTKVLDTLTERNRVAAISK